ncbi:polysaccharide deacetylase family protein, partial [bacterium]|nr:polysaccharide deacetylase family protein [bacterium]
LTVDDCPSSDFKRKVDFLLLKNIPAIFFCIGKLTEKRKKVIIYAIKNGFII